MRVCEAESEIQNRMIKTILNLKCLCAIRFNHPLNLFKRNVADVARQHHHDEDETSDHGSKPDLAGDAEEITVEVRKQEHHWRNAQQQVCVEPFLRPVNGAGRGEAPILDD